MDFDRVLIGRHQDRATKLWLNTFSSLLLQIANIASGFILPRMILLSYGTQVNGLVASITQFLAMISFFDMGVGQVVQANLYEPLTRKDFEKVSDILISAKRFFRRLARTLIVYTILLSIIYPLFQDQFSWSYCFCLVLILSITSFVQYYFGIPYQLLLNSDQRSYIQSSIQILTIVLNVILSLVMMRLGYGIHIVKLVTSIVFVIRPFLLYLYIQMNYKKIDLGHQLDYEPIQQKWNGMAQHVASVVLNNTDAVVLTLFSTLSNVSVYSMYNMVAIGVSTLFNSLMSGMQPLLGEFWARKDSNKIKAVFTAFSWFEHTLTIIAFGVAATLIVPFIRVFTEGIKDYNYINYTFAIVYMIAISLQCFRLPYNILVMACGKFKETQSCYIIAALINIVTSVLSVIKFGLEGVAIGTLIALLWQTVWLIRYVWLNLLRFDLESFSRTTITNLIIIAVSIWLTRFYIFVEPTSYLDWLHYFVIVTIIWCTVDIAINLLINGKYLIRLFKEVSSIAER